MSLFQIFSSDSVCVDQMKFIIYPPEVTLLFLRIMKEKREVEEFQILLRSFDVQSTGQNVTLCSSLQFKQLCAASSSSSINLQHLSLTFSESADLRL